jgi:predicted transcriptional regulator
MANNVDTRVITSHVPVPLADQVDALAVRMERSRGWIVKQALAEFVALEERRYRLTLEGLASVDAGEGVPQEEVEAWIDSLGTDRPLPMPK